MNYINKQIAENVAFDLLKSNREKIEQKQRELSIYCRDRVIERLPISVLNAYNELPEGWMNTTIGFSFTAGYQYKHVHLIEKLPAISNTINVERKEFEKIASMQDSIIAMKQKLKVLQTQIVNTLLKLRTAPKIEKEFPQAYKLLPKEFFDNTKVPAIAIKSILESIDNF